MRYLFVILTLLFQDYKEGQEIADCKLIVNEGEWIKYNALGLNNTMIGMQSGSGLKILKLYGNGIFVHNKLALEEDVYQKPLLTVGYCSKYANFVIDSSRFKIVIDKSCEGKVTYVDQ